MGLRVDMEAERIEALRPEERGRPEPQALSAPTRQVFRSQWMQTGRRPF